MRPTSADHLALTDLVARYGALVDDRSPAVADLFCPDAVLGLPEPPESLEPVAEHEGRAMIREALGALGDFPVTQHALVGSVFDDGAAQGEATGRIACIAHHVRERPSGELGRITWHLRYLDRYRHTAQGWRIASRAVHIDWIETARPRGWRIGGQR